MKVFFLLNFLDNSMIFIKFFNMTLFFFFGFSCFLWFFFVVLPNTYLCIVLCKMLDTWWIYPRRNFASKEFPCLSEFSRRMLSQLLTTYPSRCNLRAFKTRHCAWRQHVSVAIRRHKFTSLCHSGSHNTVTTTRRG